MIALLALLAQTGEPAPGALLPAPSAPPSCSVTLRVDVRETAEGATERQVYAYDRGADTWTYLTQDGKAPSEEAADEAADDAADRTLPAGYHAEATALGARGGMAWQSVSNDLYRLSEVPDEQIVMNGRDVSGRVALDYQVEEAPGGPRLVSERAFLKEPWRVPFVAMIEAFEITRDYAPAGAETGAEGAMLPISERITFQGHVTGKARDSLIVTSYEDWDCVPGTGG